ncbi:MAG: biopolymer transporter ExbD [Planctomycetota bacterium]
MPLVDTMERENEIKGDMTPMIDIIFLLLIFFILTTKFVPNEKAISNLMPTDQGQAKAEDMSIVEPPQDINVRIWPAGLSFTSGPAELQQTWDRMESRGTANQQATMQIGNGPTLLIDGKGLSKGADKSAQTAQVAKVHEYIRNELEKREISGDAMDRSTQNPVVIHCFSGLAWKYGLVAFDAVRNYEAQKAGSGLASRPDAMDRARKVNFAPSRSRLYENQPEGNELADIINLK